MKLPSWITSPLVEIVATSWIKDNLTTPNIKKGFEAFCEWASDPNIREALGRLAKFCVSEIVKEIKNNLNSEQK